MGWIAPIDRDIDFTVATAHAVASFVIARQWASIRWLARQVVAADGNYRTTDAGLGIACGLCPRMESFQRLMNQASRGPVCAAAHVAEIMDARLDRLYQGDAADGWQVR